MSVLPAVARPNEVNMSIHTGMLESLGINMYTSIAKCLVEFIANGFDADASKVQLSIPFDEIEKARSAIKVKAAGALAGAVKSNSSEGDTLSEDIAIVIQDNGHGMTIGEIEERFLSVNRNRRKALGDKSENGLRKVMGRKGLGKLAGFGVAEQVIIRTKRAGETYASTILMDFHEIQKHETIGDVKFTPNYEEGLEPDLQGTTITLRKLRRDSLKSKESNIEWMLATNFYITGDDFRILLNDQPLAPPNIAYEFTYPDAASLDSEGFATTLVVVNENFNYPIRYNVKFRSRGKSDGEVLRGSVPAFMRGARVYCNQRLAAGPSLFRLHTGMHNFHSQSYMECVVHADVLDQQETDLIGTNRSALKTDNDLIDAFEDTVTELMRLALYNHSKFREEVVDKEIKSDPVSRAIMAAVEQVPKKNREPALKILKTLAISEGIDSPAYQEVAPLLVKAINASEILVELIRTGISPTNLTAIIGQLSELSSIERSDTLKLYRARRNGILGLQKLEEDSHKGGRSDQYESELHSLLKNNPWLIRPEYSHYLTSDSKMGEVVRKINAQLEIDDNAKSDKSTYTDTRPDLVFVMVDGFSPAEISIVELKSPNIPLNNDHLTQLEKYIVEIENIVQTDYRREVKVSGHLIGNLPKTDTRSMDAKLLLSRIKSSGPNTRWEVVPIPVLLERAKKSHLATIEALELEETQITE